MSVNSPDTAAREDEDDASCLSYFSSFNRQSFETGNNESAPPASDAAPSHELPAELSGKAPHPPMRSTITPITIAIPPGDLTQPAQTRRRSKRGGARNRKSGSSSPNQTPTAGGNSSAPTPAAPSPSMPSSQTPPTMPPMNPIAQLVQQHNHTMAAQLSTTGQNGGTAIPTILLQPLLVNLTPEQQQVAAQMQDQFFRLITDIGRNSPSPLSVIAPNPAVLQSAPAPSNPMMGTGLQPTAGIFNAQQQHGGPGGAPGNGSPVPPASATAFAVNAAQGVHSTNFTAPQGYAQTSPFPFHSSPLQQ
eukprot:CAMPEP_0174828706 /NCGR_PEP_ID=MMETSP1114-20130205/1493_1 /TAXON_ID=312471 /ORGANISM="Neobodo designis, Strain CCAP 1951/1" /LENGTH=303 /DNA_ID=CAMNT_0016062429 /DNA_START=35 /DNA_END=946 /DNA_ORIENTATION=-